jgi:N-acetyltransferase
VAVTPASVRSPLLLGVRAMWVHSTARRRGVATILLDVARQVACFGATVPRAACAFTSPTAAGRAFATRYCGTARLLVYNP